MAEDLVAGAVAELYGADPDAFTERRKALAAAAREAGDKQSAATIAALRKPTRAAWLVNRLARAEPDAPARLAALAAELRAAERAKDGARLRELSADRGALIDALTDRALAATGVLDPPSSLREEVTATLTAALADPGTAAAFAAGNLTKAAQWSGFGYADFAPADDSPPDLARSADARDRAPVDLATRRSRRARAATESGSGSGSGAGAPRPRRTEPPPVLPPRSGRTRDGRRKRSGRQRKNSGQRGRQPSGQPVRGRNSMMPNGPWLRRPPSRLRPPRSKIGWRRRSVISKDASPRRGRTWPRRAATRVTPRRPSAEPGRRWTACPARYAVKVCAGTCLTA